MIVHVIFFLSPPLSLTDVFNYLNYGRMEAVYHLNPYTTIPALEPHTDPTFLLSNWHGLLSPYGPLFTVFTMALVPLGVAGSFWAMKMALMVASLATVFLVYRCADLLGRNPLTAAVIIGINPIVLVWGLGGRPQRLPDDLLPGARLLAAAACQRDADRQARAAGRGAAPATAVGADLRRVWAWLDGMPRPLVVGEPAAWMEIGAGIALVAAVAIKASSAVLVPIIVAGAARRIRVATGVVIGLVAASAMTVIAFGVNLPNVGQQDRLVIPDGIPNLIGLALGFGGYTSQMRTVLTLLLVAAVAGAVGLGLENPALADRVRRRDLCPAADARLDAAVVHPLAAAVRRVVALARPEGRRRGARHLHLPRLDAVLLRGSRVPAHQPGDDESRGPGDQFHEHAAVLDG